MAPFHFKNVPDDVDVNVKYNFKGILPQIGEYYHKTPLFGYDYISIGNTGYCFDQECLDNVDIRWYFKKMKMIASKSINSLIDESNKGEHFHLYNSPNKNIIDLLKVVLNKTYIRQEEMPVVGQIALYTNKELADRNNGTKSPRIYFMVGPHAVLYILFYDPYHEINPGNNKE